MMNTVRYKKSTLFQINNTEIVNTYAIDNSNV